jgi:hypothetical protein
VKHPDLYVASQLPYNLGNYDFIFLDSVSKLGLTADDLTRLKGANPTKSFIYIFQTTKEGKFRGENTFQHDVDVVIQIPEKGKAVVKREEIITMRAIALCFKPYLKPEEALIYCNLGRTQFVLVCE